MSNPTILCVDDELNVLLTLRTQLLRHFPNYRIEIAESAEEALELVAQLMVHGDEIPLIIADQIMPQMKGDELLIELHHRYPQMLKVMLTGQAKAEDVGHVVNLGSLYRFIAKPWNETDLRLTVAEAMRSYQQEQQIRQQQVALEQANRELAALNADLEKQVRQRTQQLHRNEQQLRLFVEHTPAAVAMFDRDMRYILTSYRWKTDYELGEQEIIGRSHYEVFPEIPDRWKAIHQRCLAGTSERCEEDYFVREDGSVIWNQWEIHPWYTDEDEIGGIILFSQVLTERKQTELALRESETRLRLALEVSGAIVWERDLQTNEILFSSTTASLDFQKLSYENSLALVHPDDRANLHRANQEAVADRSGFRIEHRVAAPGQNSEWQWFQVTAKVLTDEAGQPIRMIGMSIDITARKQAEDALRQSEERFREIAQTVSQLFFIRSAITGEFIYVSPAYESIWGRSCESLYQDPQSWVEAVHPDDRFLVNQSLMQQFAGHSIQREYRIVQPDGEVRWISAQLSLVCDGTGEPLHSIGIASDITDRKLAEIALRESEQRYATLAEASPVGIFRNDVDGSLIYANDRWYEITGFNRAVGRRADWLQGIHPDWRDRFPQNWQQMGTEGDAVFETCFLHPDGTLRWVYCQVLPEYNQAGVAIGWVGTLTDITQLKQVEASLLEAQRLAHIGNWSFDLETQEIIWSEELYYMFGLDPAQPVPAYAEYLEKIHPEDRSKLLYCVEQAVQHGTSYALDYRAIHADGSIRYHEGRGAAIQNAQGQVVKLHGTALDITDRKQAEAKIQQSEELLQLTLSFTGIGAWNWQPSTGEYFWNGQMEMLLEIPAGLESMFQLWRERIHPDDVDRIDNAIQTALAEGNTFAEEYRYRLLDGRTVWRWVKGQGIYTETGEVERVLGVVQDIDDRKTAESRLQQTTEELDRFFSVALDLLCIANADGYFLRLNPAWEKALGYSLDELRSHKFLDFVHPDDLSSTLDTIEILAQQQEILNFVNRYRHQNGSYRWIEWRSIPVGNLVYAAARDITDRKQAEMALQESKRFLSMALSAAKAGVWEWDLVTNRTYWSDENFRLMGYEPGSIEMSHESWLQVIHPDDRQQAETYIAQVIADRDELNLEYRVLLPDGTVRWLVDIGRIVEDAQGNPLAMNGIQIDITDRKRAEAQLEAHNVLLEQIAKGEALSDILGAFIDQIEQQLEGAACSVMFLETDNRLHPAAAQNLPPAYIHAVDGVWVGEGEGSCGTAAFRNQTVIVSDIANDLLWINYKDLALTNGLRACWSIPILASDGHVLGTFAVYYSEVRSPQPHELETVLQMANIAGIAIEREQAEVTLRESERRYATLMEVVPVGIFRFDATGNCVYVNHRWSEMTGRPAESALGQGWLAGIYPEDRDQLLIQWQQALEQGEVNQAEGRHLRPDGSINWFYGQVLPEKDAEGISRGYVGALTDITDRKRIELSLQQSEAKQRALISALPDLIMRVNQDGIYLDFFTTASFKVLGERDTVVGTSVGSSLPADLAQQRMEAIQSALQTKEIQVYEQEIWVEGELQTEECRVVVCGNDEVLIIVRDITDRKRAETALQQSEERRRLALELTETGSWEFEIETGEAIWSDSYYRLLGLIPGETCSDYQTWRSLVYPDDLQWVEKKYIQALKKRSLFDVEYRVLHPDGKIRWMLTKGQGIYDSDGQALRMLGVMIDITDRKQAEAALQTSEERWQLAIEGSNDGIWDHHLTTNEHFLSPRCLEMLGYTAEEIGSFDQWLDYIHPEDRSVMQTTLKTYLDRKLPIYAHECRVRHKDGSYRWLLARGKVLRDEADKPLRMVGSLTDTTLRRQAELELQRLNEELEQRVQKRTQDLQQANAQLRDSEERFQTFMNNSPTATWISDADGVMVYVNRTYSRMFAVLVPNILNQSLFELYPDDVARRFLENTRIVAVTNQVLEAIEVCPRPDGTMGDFLVYKFPVSDSSGRRLIGGIAVDITERKQAEAALRDSEERLRLALMATNQGLYDLNLQTGQAIVSPEYATMLGYDPATFEETNARWIERLHPDDQPTIAEVYRAYVTGEIPNYQVEFRQRTQDGRWKWILSLGRIVAWDEAEQPLRMLGTHTDIDDRKRSEAALRDSEERFRATFEQASVGIVQVDLEGRFVKVNQKFCEIVGYSEAELFLKSFVDITYPADLKEDQANVRQLLVGETPNFVMEKRYVRQDGKLVWANLSVSLVRDFIGEPQYFIGVVQDISDRKLAEEALQSERLRLQLALDAAGMGTWSCSPVTGRLIWSDRAQEIFGFIPGTFPGDRDTFVSMLHPEDAERVLQAIADSFETGLPYNIEYRIYGLDGEMRWIAVWGVIPQELSASERQIIGVVADITDRKQAEEALRQLNTELETRVQQRTLELQATAEAAEAANRAKTTFLANMSHELRTPLNAILGFSQLLNRDDSLNAAQRDQVSVINRSGEHLLNLINDILAMSKIEAGRITLTVKSFDLRSLLESLAELFHLKAETKGISLSIQSDPAIPQYIQTDESKLRQILINLLGNAIKFTHEGAVVLRVQWAGWAEEMSPAALSAILRFEVEDTGIGIDPAEQIVVFEPFGQTQAGQRSQEGTGLGLPISRQFVQLMGGELGFTSLLNQGSTFYFTIPVGLVQASEVLPPAPVRHVTGLAGDQPTYRLLVVEDNRENGQFLVQLLQSVGFEVQAAVNGQEAVQMWQSWAPHLIWMDMRMPVMNGYAAVRRIRELEKAEGKRQKAEGSRQKAEGKRQKAEGKGSFGESHGPQKATKILALTASAFEDERAAILAAGCDDFVFKPATETVLFEKIAEHLGVQYVYQSFSESAAPIEPTSDNLLPADVLQVMPSDWVLQLQRAARMADEDLILELIDQIPADHSWLADRLKELVGELRLDRLIEITSEPTPPERS